MTKSPKSIQEVAQPIEETSAMHLIITLPGKVPNILGHCKQDNSFLSFSHSPFDGCPTTCITIMPLF